MFLKLTIPRFQGENLDKNKIMYSSMGKLAEKHGCTIPQLALAWLLHQGNDVVPIPGTTKIMNLDNNIGCLRVKLSKEDMNDISQVMAVNEVVGDRSSDNWSHCTWKFADTPQKDG
ncbi:hypothetical protein ACFE04_028518 [Oxalis oulophora]